MFNGLCLEIDVLTEPEIGPSCADLPLTLKVTPFGAFDLTSRFAVTTSQRTAIKYEVDWLTHPL